MDNFKLNENKTYSLEELLDALLDKSFDLVWLARKPHPDDAEGMAEFYDTGCCLKTRIHMAEIAQHYPEEVEALKSPIEGDWHHGFNSGMLATVRFLSTALQLDITDEQLKELQDSDPCDNPEPYNPLLQAWMDFPMLDT